MISDKNQTNYTLFILIVALCYFQDSIGQISPVKAYGSLFRNIQMNEIYDDSKTFVDCVPFYPADSIMLHYNTQKNDDDFNLRVFTIYHFGLPHIKDNDYKTNIQSGIEEHINNLWDILKRNPDTLENTSLIPLPNPYIVPGGRFREIYYWDSYFTMLGLKTSAKDSLCKNMVDNFAYLIEKYGFIPNGNRTYYLSRSQPPFFALMLQLTGLENDLKYLQTLKKEHDFWTSKDKMPDAHIYLSRYTDTSPNPRPESFLEDSLMAKNTDRPMDSLYLNLRAACESGWDFSSRWFNKDLSNIETSNIYPVDLNCLLYFQEKILADNNLIDSKIPEKRKKAILKYCWDKEHNFFTDYNFLKRENTGVVAASGMFPLYFEIASKNQAKHSKKAFENHLLKDGGVVTTTNTTGQQWDAPNGWAPMQYICVEGLKNYHYDQLAELTKVRFMRVVESVFLRAGKIMEKYNVEDPHTEAGGGEYPGQDGFGWTNGVYLYFLKN